MLCVILYCSGWPGARGAFAGQPWELAQSSTDVSAYIHEFAATGRLRSMRWPDFSSYRLEVLQFYEQRQFASAWLDDDEPTKQALILIQVFEQSEKKGLNPEDYDAARWKDRLDKLQKAPTANSLAQFDVALTVSAMRYVSDLRFGRVKPANFSFGIDVQSKKYDLAQFLAQSVVSAKDLPSVLYGVEPPYEGYRRTEVALDHYQELAARGDGPLVPQVKKTVAPGDRFAGTDQLAHRLELLGDLSAAELPRLIPDQYSGALVAGVEHFQARHGLTVDGKLGRQTVRALNVPLAKRVHQLEDALERWRWLPPSFPQPPIVVNIPEFKLRAIGSNHKVALTMKVVVGRAVRTQTPVFAADMRSIVFRPYWNVPRSILRKEIMPDIIKNRNYLAIHGFEVTDRGGRVVTSGRINDTVLAALRAGTLEVRQKPGPKNSLGLVKFLFPNEHDVYLHDTPATQLFARSRRDFSHGCIRVEKPADLAAWLLRNQATDQGPLWTPASVRAAMESGQDDMWVNLRTPIPVLILYITAVVEGDGSVHFFDDIYGHDKLLEKRLAHGRPYPRMPVSQ